jgi:NitT/TauT family transport system substrate-binding protein
MAGDRTDNRLTAVIGAFIDYDRGGNMKQPGYRNKISWLGMHLSALAIFFPILAKAADQPAAKPLEKVRIAYSAISGSQLVGWVAYDAGFFRKNGLDVDFIYIEGGPRAVQSLASGEVQLALVAGAPVLQSNLRGSPVVLVTGFLNTLDYQFVVDKQITRPDQLKGKSVAVSQAGSSSDFAMRYALDKYGLQPEKDVTIVEIGSQPGRFAALESGKIQGVMVAVPLTLTAKKMGFNILADLQMLGLEYQYTALATTRDLIKSRPDLVRSAVKACVEAIHYLKTHRKEALELLRKYMKTDDTAALVETYEAIGLNLIPDKPYPTLRGIQVMLQELAPKDPRAKAARPEQFVDMSFVKELDVAGFIDRLYKDTPVVASGETRSPAPSPSTTEKGTPAAQKEQLFSKTKHGNEKLAQASKPPSTTHEYTVKAGDTLSHLALRFYGNPAKWPKIYEANRGTLKNPNYIYIGQTILLPADAAPPA